MSKSSQPSPTGGNSTKDEGKPSRLRRLAESAAAWTGGAHGWNFLKDIRLPGSKFFRQQRELYEDNVAREEEFQRMEFERVLSAWGIYNDADAVAVVKSKRREFYLGLVIAALGVWGFASQFSSGIANFVRMMNSLFTLSMVLLGVVMAMTSWWRIRVLEERKFVPFLKWLRSGFRFGKEG